MIFMTFDRCEAILKEFFYFLIDSFEFVEFFLVALVVFDTVRI